MMCLLWAGRRVVIRSDVEKRSMVLIEQARMSASTASLKRPFLVASVPRCDSLDPTMMRDMKNEAVAFLSFVWMPGSVSAPAEGSEIRKRSGQRDSVSECFRRGAQSTTRPESEPGRGRVLHACGIGDG